MRYDVMAQKVVKPVNPDSSRPLEQDMALSYNKIHIRVEMILSERLQSSVWIIEVKMINYV